MTALTGWRIVGDTLQLRSRDETGIELVLNSDYPCAFLKLVKFGHVLPRCYLCDITLYTEAPNLYWASNPNPLFFSVLGLDAERFSNFSKYSSKYLCDPYIIGDLNGPLTGDRLKWAEYEGHPSLVIDGVPIILFNGDSIIPNRGLSTTEGDIVYV